MQQISLWRILMDKSKVLTPLGSVYRHAYFALREVGQETHHKLVSRVPAKWVPKSRQLSDKLSIGISTYEGRYLTHFRPLIELAESVFDDIRIYVAVNGAKDYVEQRRYVEALAERYAGNRRMSFLIHSEVVGLSRLWNEIVTHSKTPQILVLNDDVLFDPWFRRCIQTSVDENDTVTTFNGSWSHFVLDRTCYQQIGPFDEGLIGIGFEDMDYVLRMHQQNMNIRNVASREIYDLNHQPETTSFDHIGGRVWGKFTQANERHFMKKYRLLSIDEVSSSPEAVFIKQFGCYVVPRKTSNTRSCRRTESLTAHGDDFDGFIPMEEGAERILKDLGVGRRGAICSRGDGSSYVGEYGW